MTYVYETISVNLVEGDRRNRCFAVCVFDLRGQAQNYRYAFLRAYTRIQYISHIRIRRLSG